MGLKSAESIGDTIGSFSFILAIGFALIFGSVFTVPIGVGVGLITFYFSVFLLASLFAFLERKRISGVKDEKS